MANKFLGEGSVTANGKTYRLRFDMGVLADLEGQFAPKRTRDILAEIEGDNPSITTMRVICHAMLKRHHPEATLLDASDIMSEDMEGMMAVIQAANPEAANPETTPGNGAAKPAKTR